MTASHPKGEMAACGMANYSSSGEVEPRVRRHCLKNIAGRQADVLKGSRPTTARVAYPPILYVARDYSLRCQGGAEMSYVRQVITGLPEATMDNEEQWERSLAAGKS